MKARLFPKAGLLLVLFVAMPIIAAADERPYERYVWSGRGNASGPVPVWTIGDEPPLERTPTPASQAPAPTTNVPGPSPVVATTTAGGLFERAAGFEKRTRPRASWTEGDRPND